MRGRCGAPSSARSRTQLSEKILFDEIGPGQLVTVDVENWDGEGAGEDAVFTFVGAKKPAKVDEPDLAQAGAAGAPTRHCRRVSNDNAKGPDTVERFRGLLRCCCHGGLDLVLRMLDVIDGRRNLVRIQNGRATV